MKIHSLRIALPVTALGAALWLNAATPAVNSLIRQANGEVLLTSAADAGAYYRIETSPDFQQWTALTTIKSTGSDQFLDSASRPHGRRFYRATEVTGTGIITGDHLQTSQGDAVLHPIGHASVLVTWNGKVIYSDPSDQNSNGPKFTGLPAADIVVITHGHTDHFDAARVNLLFKTGTVIFAPQYVKDSLPNIAPNFLRNNTTALANGGTGSAYGVSIRAIAMYNLSNTPHSQVTNPGNGYVITLGGKNVYFSGDTENTPEMRALTGIDVAFVCMSEPSNMTDVQAAGAVLAFRPRVVYPYHYRQSGIYTDIANFKSLVGADPEIEVRLRSFY